MPINSTKPFPSFDKDNPTAILGIPDNISRTFDNYVFTFKAAGKDARISRDSSEWRYNGDYFIIINEKIPTDPEMLKESSKRLIRKDLDTIKKEIFSIEVMTIEEEVYNRLICLTDKIELSDPTQAPFVQQFIYYSWHRCQIEDRLFPREVGWRGRNMYLNDGVRYI